MVVLSLSDKFRYLKSKKDDLSKSNRSLRLLGIADKWTFDLSELDLDVFKESKQTNTKQLLKNLLRGKDSFLIENQDADEQTVRLTRKLTNLYRNLNHIEQELGQYSLYVGYPFIKGTLNDASFIQAPVFLFPVRLERNYKNTRGWTLVVSSDEIVVNRALMLAIKKYNGLNIDDAFLEDAKTLPPKNIATWTKEFLEQIGLSCEVVPSEEMTPLTTYSSKDIPDMAGKIFEIHSHLILGQFFQSNSTLTRDYDELIKYNDDNIGLGLIHDILLEEGTDKYMYEASAELAIDDVPQIPEIDRYLVTELDGSQEEVIIAADKEKGLVVYGPPGTGKSQVIVNLISQALSKNQKILVVCQKRVALEVVYRRLEGVGLADRIAIIHNSETDKKALFQKIHQATVTSSSANCQAVRDEHNYLSEEIDKKSSYFNNISASLYEQQPCGLSLFRLYAHSKKLSVGNILINLEELPEKFQINDLRRLESKFTLLGNLYGNYGRDDYSWKNRRNFAKLEQSNLYDLKKQLSLLINALEDSYVLKESSIKASNYLALEGLFSKALTKSNHYEDGNILSKWIISLWFKLKGKRIIASLNRQGQTIKLASPDWLIVKVEIQQTLNYIESLSHINDIIAQLASCLNSNFIKTLKEAVSIGTLEIKLITTMVQDLEADYEDLAKMDRMIDDLNAHESRLYTILTLTSDFVLDGNLGEHWLKQIYQSFFTRWIDKAETLHPLLKNLNVDRYAEDVQAYKKLNTDKVKLVRDYLNVKLIERTQPHILRNDKKIKELRHQTGKTRQLWSIRKLLKEFTDDGIFDFIPVWLVSPEMVSVLFPLEKELFDVVIFDEASQCSVEDSIPSLYRAKKVIVAGDEKQLQPLNLFKASASNDDDENEEEGSGIQDSQSILNLAKRCYPSRLLEWHYRSQYEELINFSNHAFYEGKMQVAPNAANQISPPPIEWVQVSGVWTNQFNEIEANQVAQTLSDVFTNYPGKSVGIITFNIKQQEKILNVIDKLQVQDLEFAGKYAVDMTRPKDDRLFVKNIESVQGDERDVIIFSLGYGRDIDGRIRINFGQLSQEGGENRLNVAISRAKEKVFIVSSIFPHELDVSGAKHNGAKLFKNYLEYAYAVAHQDEVQIVSILKEVNSTMKTLNASENLEFDSPFEEEVYDELAKRGFHLRTQVGCSGYRIDMAVINSRDPSKFVLGIECDGATYHSSRSAKERDIYRQLFLENKGWKIIRVWSRDWWKNPIHEVNRIEKTINDLLQECANN